MRSPKIIFLADVLKKDEFNEIVGILCSGYAFHSNAGISKPWEYYCFRPLKFNGRVPDKDLLCKSGRLAEH